MIRVDMLFKRFGEKSVLNGVSLKVSKGEIVFLIGRSGVGKSVLLKSIVGLIKPDAGDIWVDEWKVNALDETGLQTLRRSCGLVFQGGALLDSLTVRENIAFGLRFGSPSFSESEIEERVKDILLRVRLSPSLLSRLPQELSFGLQKRVSLARTLAIQPNYLLFDEPTTGLDPIATRAVNEVILSLSHRGSVASLIVSHDIESALEIADHVFFVDKGEIVEHGSPHQIRQSGKEIVKEFLRGIL